MTQAAPPKTEQFDVVIVGAGISRVGAAYHLARQLGRELDAETNDLPDPDNTGYRVVGPCRRRTAAGTGQSVRRRERGDAGPRRFAAQRCGAPSAAR